MARKFVEMTGRGQAIPGNLVQAYAPAVRMLNDIVAADRAKIERGPFADFICTVDDIHDDQRAWVLIDLLQQQTKVEVPLGDVSKIN